MTARSPTLVELDDYLHGGLQSAEVDEVEVRLFDAAQTADDDAAQFLHELQQRASWLAKEQQFGESHTRAHVDALLARDPRVHYLQFDPGTSVDIPIWKPDTTRVVLHARIDLRGYEQIEVAAGLPGREPLMTFRGVVPDPVDGHAYAVCFEPLARMAFSVGRLHWRVTAQRDGKRETVAELTTQLVL